MDTLATSRLKKEQELQDLIQEFEDVSTVVSPQSNPLEDETFGSEKHVIFARSQL